MIKNGTYRALLCGTAITLALGAVPALAQETAQGQSAQADTAPAADSGSGNDIVVTARRTEERLQDVPISITVFNQQQLTNRNIVNPQDLATYTPSLTANSNFGSQNASFAIRGFVQEIGTSPSVGVYFADVVSPRAASPNIQIGDGAGPGSFFDLQNVQVLKGPQGTLFGRNTTGGAILLVPQKPTSRLEGYVEGSIGNYDMRRVQAVLNVPLSDTFRVRLGIDRQVRKGYLRNTSGIGPSDFNDVNYWAGRLSIVGDLTPDLENYTIFTFNQSDTHGDLQKLVAADPLSPLGHFASEQMATATAAGDGFYDIRQDVPNPQSLLRTWQVINTTTWKASDTLTVKNIASYGELKDTLRSANFATNFETPAIPVGLPIAVPSYGFGFASVQPLGGHETADESTFTEEFQLQGRSGDDRLTWQAGAYFESAQPLDTVGSQSPAAASCTNVATFQCSDPLAFLGSLRGPYAPAGLIIFTAGRQSFRDVGLYAQGTYKLSDQFRVTGGFRYTWDRTEAITTQKSFFFNPPFVPAAAFTLPNGSPAFTGRPFTPLPEGLLFATCTFPNDVAVNDPNAPNGCTRNLSQSSSRPTWLIDFDYTPSQDVLIYAKYARGYRAGGVAPNSLPQLSTFQPEKVDTFELGTKTSFHGPVRGSLNVSAFYNKFSNQQLLIGLSGTNGNNSQSSAILNAGASRIYGLEVDATLSPFRGFDIQAGYTYLNTRLNAVTNPQLPANSPFVATGAFLVGDPLVLSPKNKFQITASYALPLDDSIGRVSVGATFVHSDSVFANPGDRFYAGSVASDPAVVAQIRSLSTLPATNLLNLNVNWDNVAGMPVDLEFFATNVTKQKYYSFTGGLGTLTGFETSAVGAPQMYGARLRFRFGS